METSAELVSHGSGALGTVPDVAVNKAYFIGDKEGTQSQILHEPDKQQSIFQSSGALMPLYDPAGLAVIFENSSCLRSCVDAMVTNIDSFGQTFIPIIDLTQANSDDLIRNALRIERKQGKKLASPNHIGQDDEPTDKEVKDRKELLKVEIAEERARLETFFENCTVDMPFAGPEGLRGLTRADLEIQGNAYWEILRDSFGEVAQFNHVPATSVRLWPLDDENTETKVTEKISLLTTRKKEARKKYRRFIQCWEANTKAVYFKEYGDPRSVSALTGKAYVDKNALVEAEGKDGRAVVEATELFWFKISSQRTSYGAPRWIGTLLAVLGNRQSEEGNFIYFENRSVPPLAVLVSGGRLHSDSVAKLESHIANNIKGARNNHKILILEAERVDSQAIGAAGAGAAAQARMKIEIVPLTDSQQKDALFQGYDERNTDKVGQSFRLPRLLRGDVRDFNRSCYSDDTETLTETGWKLQEAIGPEEKIAAFNKDTGEVVFVVPTKKLVYDVVDEKMWHFSNKKTDFCVTAEHTTLYKLSGDKLSDPWIVGTAAQMPRDRVWVPIAGKASDEVFVVAPECDCSEHRNGGISETLLGDDSLAIETYTGKVYCFSVPGYGFFVTRRNGKPAIQGNTAEASIDFAEVQVFGPIRQEFDWRINKRILAEMGIKYHQFRSNAPAVRDPNALSLIIERLVKAMVITPEEARVLATGVFNHELPIIDSPWVKQPIALTLAAHQVEDNKATPGDEATRYHDGQLQPPKGKDGKVDSGAGVNGYHYQSSGTSVVQEQEGVDNGMGAGVEKRRVGKNVFAGEGEGDEGSDVSPGGLFDEDEDQPARGRRLPRAARALIKLHKNFTDAEREQATKAWAGFERQIIKLPAEEFMALFEKVDGE